MKVILATITLIDLLAIGIIGTNISSLENAFAQINGENPPLMEEDKNSIEIMTMSINPSLWSTGLEQLVKSTIGEAFKAKENVNMIDEIKQEITWYDQHDKMKDGEKGDKYGYDNKGMTGDKKY